MNHFITLHATEKLRVEIETVTGNFMIYPDGEFSVGLSCSPAMAALLIVRLSKKIAAAALEQGDVIEPEVKTPTLSLVPKE